MKFNSIQQIRWKNSSLNVCYVLRHENITASSWKKKFTIWNYSILGNAIKYCIFKIPSKMSSTFWNYNKSNMISPSNRTLKFNWVLNFINFIFLEKENNFVLVSFCIRFLLILFFKSLVLLLLRKSNPSRTDWLIL